MRQPEHLLTDTDIFLSTPADGIAFGRIAKWENISTLNH
jgi:hypothetical protein